MFFDIMGNWWLFWIGCLVLFFIGEFVNGFGVSSGSQLVITAGVILTFVGVAAIGYGVGYLAAIKDAKATSARKKTGRRS